MIRAAVFFKDEPAELLETLGYEREAAEYRKNPPNITLAESPKKDYATEQKPVPIIGGVSASGNELIGLEWTDSGFPPGASDEYVTTDVQKLSESSYALRLRGDSMYPPFDDGTVFVLNPELSFISGKLCAVRHIDGRCWLKFVRYRGGKYVLRALNSDYEPIYLTPDQVQWIHLVVDIQPVI